MERRQLTRLLGPQMRQEHVGKEVVIAIPLALVVQRHDKEVAPLQGFQLRRATPSALPPP